MKIKIRESSLKTEKTLASGFFDLSCLMESVESRKNPAISLIRQTSDTMIFEVRTSLLSKPSSGNLSEAKRSIARTLVSHLYRLCNTKKCESMRFSRVMFECDPSDIQVDNKTRFIVPVKVRDFTVLAEQSKIKGKIADLYDKVTKAINPTREWLIDFISSTQFGARTLLSDDQKDADEWFKKARKELQNLYDKGEISSYRVDLYRESPRAAVQLVIAVYL